MVDVGTVQSCSMQDEIRGEETGLHCKGFACCLMLGRERRKLMKLLFQRKLKARPSFDVDTCGLKERGCSHQPQQCCTSSRVVFASLRGAFTNATTANEAVKLRSRLLPHRRDNP
ncbi:hypothetical protein Pyn_06301 [Prunus yedoensis var. nudiflora]|uniref:Uncharacterized protein n=1 Tax=Prunus yedoensis var. nudiflora TaxID=2094558 RepID=A0A314ZPW7_PRUYE|nr:hypothetical protein Pyn_06301 [Prunus yedoensis var. nudiflora]